MLELIVGLQRWLGKVLGKTVRSCPEKLELSCVLDKSACKTQDSDLPFINPQQQRQIPEQQESIGDNLEQFEDAYDGTFKNFRGRALDLTNISDGIIPLSGHP